MLNLDTDMYTLYVSVYLLIQHFTSFVPMRFLTAYLASTEEEHCFALRRCIGPQALCGAPGEPGGATVPGERTTTDPV